MLNLKDEKAVKEFIHIAREETERMMERESNEDVKMRKHDDDSHDRPWPNDPTLNEHLRFAF